jgi:hypothetical protein
MLTKNLRALIHACPNNLLTNLSQTHSVLCLFVMHRFTWCITKPYALTYLLRFIMWTLQVLRNGQYSSTEPLEWIIDGQERSTCRLNTKLQPGVSPGFLRPCGKNTTKKDLLLIENCPSNWTDHETAQKCKAYAFYSKLNLSVSNKKICLQFTS